MRVIIYNFEDIDNNSIERRLSNGETLLERQLRMLKNLGIWEIEIAGNKVLYEYGKTCISNRRDLRQISILPYQEQIQWSCDNILLINSQMLFQQKTITNIHDSTNKCCILAEFKEAKEYQGPLVRLDMDRVVEVSEHIHGLDCAPVYPIIRISLKNSEEYILEDLKQKLNYENNSSFFLSFIRMISEKIKDILLFDENGDMKLVKTEQDYILSSSLQKSDTEERISINEPGSVISIKEILEKEKAMRIMVVHDNTFQTILVEQLFSLQNISYDIFHMSEENPNDQKKALQSFVEEKDTDFIIAIGRSSTINTCDIVRKKLFTKQFLYPELKLIAVPNYLSENYEILSDYMVIDKNIMNIENEGEDSSIFKTKVSKTCKPSEKCVKKNLLTKIKKNKLTRKLYQIIFKKGLFKLYQIIYSINVRLIVFESYGGSDQDGYSCNTRAIYEAMIEEPDYFDYKFIWAFEHPAKFSFLMENPNTIIVKRGSRRHLKFCAKAGYIFTNTGLPRYIKPGRHQKLIYTWHGKPLKRIGCSFKGKTEGKRNQRQLLHDYTDSGKKLSVLLSPAPVFSPIMAAAYNLSPQKRKTAILESGYPRNDYLFKYSEQDRLRIKMNLHIPLDKKVILYAPTWRPFGYLGGRKYKHTEILDWKKMKIELGDDCVILCRLHNLERGSMKFDQYPQFLYDVSNVKDINELYIISDLLVSDYSGTIFDFANLKRPIVLFMYDLDNYQNQANGLNFDLDFLPGPIVKTQDELVKAIRHEMDFFIYDRKYQVFNETCNCLDGPDCSIKTARRIVEINPDITKKQKLMSKAKTSIKNIHTLTLAFKHTFPFMYNENTRKIVSYHNKYNGKRCFLIGNGPSLRLSDLNMLKNEYCFGCNMIYKVFKRTDWRPAFLCASDPVVACTVSKELQEYPGCTLWVNKNAYNLMEYKGNNLIYVDALKKDKYYVHGNIAEYYVPSIATVMTFMIELAMYMGFSEIYLLGVDFSIGRSENDHFINNYRDERMDELERRKFRNKYRGENVSVHEGQIRIESRALYAYQKLEIYSKKKKHKIYNATRGGALEVFERIDFDEVINV